LSFWTAVRGRSLAVVLIAVFCLFAAVGLMALQMQTHRVSTAEIALRILLSGGFAVAYAVLAMAKRVKYFPLVIVVQLLTEVGGAKLIRPHEELSGPPLQHQLIVLAFSAMVGIILSYSLMNHFFQVEGQRYFRMRAEVALASEIHRSLVPEVSEKLWGFEIYGASVPSGDVGGDLVDVIAQPDGWTGYVADVSGHGVQSGVLMAMFKTAVRGHLAENLSLGDLLGHVHRTIFPLKLGNMFITAGILRAQGDGKVTFASAGHPAILHYRRQANDMRQYAALDPPLGVFKEQAFSESVIQCAPGDLLLILTDGFTEVFDAKQNELGLEAFETKFVKLADLPLEEIFSDLRAFTLGFGAQQDDQTMLLAKYLGN
jgi:phosphoserine phosphatase RsbU/P